MKSATPSCSYMERAVVQLLNSTKSTKVKITKICKSVFFMHKEQSDLVLSCMFFVIYFS